MLARKDLNWSVPNSRLFHEAFAGRAKLHARCQHCFDEDHPSAACPHHPCPLLVGWFQGAPPFSMFPGTPQPQQAMPTPPKPAITSEVCRNFNSGHCRYWRCLFLHLCSDCAGSHSASQCSRRLAGGGQGAAPPPARTQARLRPSQPCPYPQTRPPGSEQL